MLTLLLKEIRHNPLLWLLAGGVAAAICFGLDQVLARPAGRPPDLAQAAPVRGIDRAGRRIHPESVA